jgi:hypothetical protein
MGSVPRVGRAFSPLDEELGIVRGSLTPSLLEHVVRLGARLPFAQAAAEITAVRRVAISASTVRRQTERAGAVEVETIAAAVERLEREAPSPPPGPDKAVVSVDGAMVPLIGGIWAEVKTLAVGEAIGTGPEGEAQTRGWSYFSRLADAETFERLALWELDRRGVATAEQVGAVTDGAEWIQGFLDYHCPQARRILDFGHAAERVSLLGALRGEATATWLADQLHALKTEGPEQLLRESQAWEQAHPGEGTLREPLGYLERRQGQLDYPAYRQEGWPIGSGSVESANKLVVEARLKGAGMHWKREHVDPLLALRNALCSHRWEETWLGLLTAWREDDCRQRVQRRRVRTACREEARSLAAPRVPTSLVVAALPRAPEPAAPVEEPAPRPVGNGPLSRGRQPAALHPWRRYPAIRPSLGSPAKL